jgi:hypothetical protein
MRRLLTCMARAVGRSKVWHMKQTRSHYSSGNESCTDAVLKDGSGATSGRVRARFCFERWIWSITRQQLGRGLPKHKRDHHYQRKRRNHYHQWKRRTHKYKGDMRIPQYGPDKHQDQRSSTRTESMTRATPPAPGRQEIMRGEEMSSVLVGVVVNVRGCWVLSTWVQLL